MNNIGQTIAEAVKIKERIEELKAELKELEKDKEKVYDEIRGHLYAIGSDFTKTKWGDAGLYTKTSYSVVDREQYQNFIIAHEEWDLLIWGVNRTAAEVFKNEHSTYPPGIDVTKFQDVRIYPPKEKKVTTKKVEVVVREKFDAFSE